MSLKKANTDDTAEAVKSVAVVILAAGASRRMGVAKQLLPVGGKTLVRRSVETACDSQADAVFLVSGASCREVEDSVAGLPVTVVYNDQWAQGQSTSIVAGLSVLPPSVRAVIFMLADQPFLTSGIINRLIAAYRQGMGPTIAPTYKGRRGNPLLFDLAVWRERLSKLTGDSGARNLLPELNKMATVELDNDIYFRDIDTTADYQFVVDYLKFSPAQSPLP